MLIDLETFFFGFISGFLLMLGTQTASKSAGHLNVPHRGSHSLQPKQATVLKLGRHHNSNAIAPQQGKEIAASWQPKDQKVVRSNQKASSLFHGIHVQNFTAIITIIRLTIVVLQLLMLALHRFAIFQSPATNKPPGPIPFESALPNQLHCCSWD